MLANSSTSSGFVTGNMGVADEKWNSSYEEKV
jgi:hypothetical protein